MSDINRPKSVAIIEWQYTPPNFFEEPTTLPVDGYMISVENGLATVEIPVEEFDKDSSIYKGFDKQLRDNFLGAQVVSRQRYTLSSPTISRYDQNGSKAVQIFLKASVLSFTSGKADFIIKDSQGGIVSDTKAERAKRRQHLSALAAKYRGSDTTAASILDSFDLSIKNSENELVHLYEIRDALKKDLKMKTLLNKPCNFQIRTGRV